MGASLHIAPPNSAEAAKRIVAVNNLEIITSMEDETKETPHSSTLSAIFRNERFHDVTLQGKDGVKVGACRCVLAARSKVLDRMLFGEFTETKMPVVELGYKGKVLQAIVEYIFTDQVPKLEETKLEANSSNNATFLLPQFRLLVALSGAALYFCLPSLSQKVHECFERILEGSSSLSFILLEACDQEGPIDSDELWKLAMSHSTSPENGSVKASNDAVALLSPAVMEQMLKHNKDSMSEFHRFEMIQQWAAVGEPEGESAPGNSKVNGRRATVDEFMKKRICLEKIDPRLLATSVAKSGLVSRDQLYEAYRAQALAAQKGEILAKECLSSLHPHVWTCSNSSVLKSNRNENSYHFIRHCRMASGIHQWAVMVERKCNHTWLGVAIPEAIDPSRGWLGSQGYAWVYGSHGKTANADRYVSEDHPEFGAGSQVTLKLDLSTKAERGGTLSASLDGGHTFFVLFDKMKMYLVGMNGFVPAATIVRPGCLRLLEIKELAPGTATMDP